jgi:C4-dicarboxylate-specific signal transduction histidine kinase
MKKRQPREVELLDARRALARRLGEIDDALRLEADQDPFFTDDLCRRSMAAIQAVARKKRQVVTLDEIGAFCALIAERRVLEQMLVALLEDAVLGTAEGGELGLCAIVDAKQGAVRFTVWDMSPPGEPSASLPLVESLAEEQHGYVTATREPSGERRVAITLPANVTTPSCSHARLVVAPALLG